MYCCCPAQGEEGPAPRALSFSYPRSLRLTHRTQYVACYQGGKKFHSSNFLLFVRRREDDGARVRFGTAVSKKIGKAAQRNRVKRLLREFFRRHQHEVQADLDIVAVPKRHIPVAKLGYASVERELKPVVDKVVTSVR
ncbi:ribonuclease P protein component [Desulfovermiculus halophilus]|jgi:ribonuclease P protein component|uniref:ribonuclease P protein component n=1 Tax=Desulfovermiculus halophilus TaxID=339722 RepID=UPI000684C147|nr:ribonuclease P protein component [Desulfovermiculus halophilus]